MQHIIQLSTNPERSQRDSMSKIAVINPYVTDFKLYDEWMHPLGLYFLLTLLKKNGHDVSFFNCLQQSTNSSQKKFNTGRFDYVEIEKPALYEEINRKYKLYGRPENELKEFLLSIPHPDLICVGSMMTYWAPGVMKTIKIIRELFTDIPIIIGGIAAQLIPDYFRAQINNCIIAGPLFTMSSNYLPISLTRALSPEDSLIDALSMEKKSHGALLISLGCPLLCSYCASKKLQPHYISRPLPVITKEVEYMITQLGIEDFAFYDDALLFKPELTLIPFLEYVKRENFNVRFHTPNGLHLRFVNEELVLLLRQAGFKTLRFGYESSALKHHKDTCSKVFRDEAAKKINIIKKCGFLPSEIGIYIMAGLKEQTPAEVLEEMDFIGSLGVNVKPVFLSPVPGTLLFHDYVQQFPQLLSDPLWHNDSFFITRLSGWDSDHVEEIRLRARRLNSNL